jgi:HAD superfamily hydrolase (TIGR01549 family)
MQKMDIAFENIKTIFLDAGNTLISMNLSWFSEELKHFDIECRVDELRRAEASARPSVSAEISRLKSTENRETSVFYIRSILNNLQAASFTSASRKAEITEYLLNAVSANGQSQKLWNNILPGVPEALEMLKKNNFQLAVVSNSNGSVENILAGLDLSHYFDHIFDSHIVGIEKPDPDFFRYAMETLNAAPETTLHIGDMYHIDVVGAWRAGIGAVLLDPFDDWRDYDCVRFPDLISFTRKIADFK